MTARITDVSIIEIMRLFQRGQAVRLAPFIRLFGLAARFLAALSDQFVNEADARWYDLASGRLGALQRNMRRYDAEHALDDFRRHCVARLDPHGSAHFRRDDDASGGIDLQPRERNRA
jgi:hypothetical protein